jgi:hypothetical protein
VEAAVALMDQHLSSVEQQLTERPRAPGLNLDDAFLN